MIFKVQITELRVNDIQLTFGINSDKQGFLLGGRTESLECNDSRNRMTTAFVRIQNEKVVTSICKNSGDLDEHINHYREIRKVSRLLSREYKFSKQAFGDVYYKIYDRMKFQKARQTCEEYGTSLPVPRSGRLSFD